MQKIPVQNAIRSLLFLAILTVLSNSVLAQSQRPGVAGALDQKTGPVCSTRTLNGRYGYEFFGTFFVAPSVPLTVASVGTMVFDGIGGVSGYDTNSFGGDVTSYPFSGSYTLAADCSGTISIDLAGGYVIENNIVVVNEGKEIFLIQTNQGTVTHGTIKR